MNNGQVCGAQTRLLVPAARVDEAAEIAADAASGYVPGPPMEPASTLGPIVNATQYANGPRLYPLGHRRRGDARVRGPGATRRLRARLFCETDGLQ